MKNLFSIEGKTALVTGGSRGIGEMMAAGFLANGAKVYISSRKADVLERMDLLKKAGLRVNFLDPFIHRFYPDLWNR